MNIFYRFLSLLPALLFWLSIPSTTAYAQQESYDDVVLVVNDRSWASRTIGEYFATRRNIPAKNIYHLDMDTSESMDSANFRPLMWKMKAWMADQGLVTSTNYIVTTKGCPLRVRTTIWDQTSPVIKLCGQASFEDCLALINGRDSTRILTVKSDWPVNRYYGSISRYKFHPSNRPAYLVTRLDAYTVEQVKNIILKAEEPARLGEGVWVLDVEPTKDGGNYEIGNTWMREAALLLEDQGLSVVLNETTEYLHGVQNVIGYASWGSNDGYSGGREGAIPKNTWLNGALAETIVSTSARTFNPGTTGGQSLIADWIDEGATAVKGYTDEPYLGAIAHPDIIFDRYVSGFNMAESFWAASQLMPWRQVVIGDPKLTLRPALGVKKFEDLVEVQVFPNPFSQQLTVHAADAGTTILSVQLMDLLGREVLKIEEKNSKIVKVDANGLTSGAYLCKVSVRTPTGEIKTGVQQVIRH